MTGSSSPPRYRTIPLRLPSWPLLDDARCWVPSPHRRIQRLREGLAVQIKLNLPVNNVELPSGALYIEFREHNLTATAHWPKALTVTPGHDRVMRFLTDSVPP